MVCGVHLGILLAVFCQAEYVCCSWATQAQRSQRQNSNEYVGLSQQDSELKRLGASDPQNGLRQASVSPGPTQKSSINSQGHSVRFGQSNLVSELKWQKPKQLNEPKKFFGLSTAIASGNSVSQYKKRPTDSSVGSKKTTLPVQQSAHKYPAGSSASLHAPSSRSSTFSSAYDGQGDSSFSQRSSNLFSPRAPSSQRHSARTQTSATAPARRVNIRRTSKLSIPSTFLKTHPAALQPRNLQSYSSTSTGSLDSSWNRSPAQGALYQPPPGSDGTRYAPSRVYSIPEQFGGFGIRRLSESVEQKSATKPLESYITSSGPIVLVQPQVQSVDELVQTHTALSANDVGQRPQAQSYTAPSAQAVSNKPQVQTVRRSQQTQVAPPAQIVSYKPQQSYTHSSAQVVVYKPQVYSERKPSQMAPSEGRYSHKPQQTFTASSAQAVPSKAQVQSAQQSAQTHTASAAHTVRYRPQAQSYTAPSAQAVSYKPQVQSERKLQQTQVAPPAQIVSYKPQQTDTAPPGQMVSYKPQVQTGGEPAQTHTASSGYIVPCKSQFQTVTKFQQTVPSNLLSFKPQQSDTAPSAQAVSYKPQAQSERRPQQVQAAPSVQIVSYKPQGLSAQSVLFKPQAQSIMKPQLTDIAPSSSQTVSYKPQVQSVREPAQTHTASSAYSVPQKPQVQTVRKPQRTQVAPSGPQVYNERKQEAQTSSSESRDSYKPQQTFSVPSAQTVSAKPQVQRVHEPSSWKRFKPKQQLILQQMQ
ncbi:uncharacterized protein LOC141802514 [Halichoeres trimaculatus]|uniref:uncharacterized protein LOC141802514 n=1 Tax=Halichoeres trimaculatus TaxID=147232 RepID=UPI003D9ECF1C